MRFRVTLLSALLLLMGLSAEAGLKRRGFEPKYVEWYGKACPTSPAAWRHVRYSIAKDLSAFGNKRAPFDGSKEKGAYLAYQWLDKCLKRPDVLDVLDSHPMIAACLRPTEQFLRWYRTYYKKHRGSRGEAAFAFAVSDNRYSKEAALRTPVPNELKDRRFLEFLSRLETVPKAFDWLREVNRSREFANVVPYQFLVFESEFPTEDVSRSPFRLLIYLPESRTGPMRFFLFGLPNLKDRASNEASSISVHEDGSFFYQYWRRKRQRSYTLERYRRLETGRCIECHKSGGPLILRPTPPSPVYSKIYSALGVPEERAKLLEALNQKILSVGLSYSRFDTTPREGAGLGEGSAARLDDAFFEVCAGPQLVKTLRRLPANQRLTEKRNVHARLEQAMNCIQCHDGKTRSLLSPPFERNLSYFVGGGHMPPGNNLRPFERVLLQDCLQREYWGYIDKEKEYVPGSLFRHLMSVPCAEETLEPVEKTR